MAIADRWIRPDVPWLVGRSTGGALRGSEAIGHRRDEFRIADHQHVVSHLQATSSRARPMPTLSSTSGRVASP